jgi:UDP:flavonoid glycosyltransferase YjiC (YdhE family)
VRILVASTAGSGHFGPLVQFLDALSRRGDDVRVIAPPALRAPVEELGIAFVAGAAPPDSEVAGLWAAFETATPRERAVLIDRELFARRATQVMLPCADALFDRWRPDLVLREPCEFASAIAAHRRGVPHAQVAISLAAVEWSSLGLTGPVLEAIQPGIVAALRSQPYISRLPSSLDPSPFPDTRRARDAEATAPAALPVRWDHDDRRPLVAISFGTVVPTRPSGLSVYQAAIDAVAELDARVLVTVGRDLDPARLRRVAAHVRVAGWVAQRDVLAQAALIVGHGGSGTTFGALAAGVPQVLVPQFADQPRNAELVIGAGAGLAAAGEPAAIRAAVLRVLGDPGFAARARRVGSEMAAAPSVPAVLAALG